MKTLRLDAEGWNSAEDVWSALLASLEAPTWHGRNLDALGDSLSGGDLNGVKAPLSFEIHHLDKASLAAQSELARIKALVVGLSIAGHAFTWSNAP